MVLLTRGYISGHKSQNSPLDPIVAPALPVAQLPLTCAVHLQGPESDKELMTNPDS